MPEGIDPLEDALPLARDRPDKPLADGAFLEAEPVKDGPQEDTAGEARQGELEKFAELLAPAASPTG